MNEEGSMLMLCPFCAGKATMAKDNHDKVLIFCENCKMYFGIEIEHDCELEEGWKATFQDEEAAMKAWNSRKLMYIWKNGMDISQNESYWDATDSISPKCNRCGKSPLYYAEVAHVRWNLRHLPKFCSSCGATMKEVLYSDKSGKVQKLQIP